MDCIVLRFEEDNVFHYPEEKFNKLSRTIKSL